jgi:hypothetical protein
MRLELLHDIFFHAFMGGVHDRAIDGSSFVQKWAISAIVSVAECKSPLFVGGSNF